MVEISPAHNSRRRRGAARFPVGSLIEVLTYEEDLYGVYFSGTVISPPSSPRKNSRRLYVEYHNLLAREDKPDRLREHVEISVVRPAPPLQEVVANGFVPNDIVDAFHKDGWWTGVVSHAVKCGERFVVTFKMPPDEHEFGLSELRAHWDWVDGVWQKQSEAVFEVGMKVEVLLEREDDGFKGAWFPATIVQDLENGAFLVEFKDKNGVCVKGEVDTLHVRPSPPIIKGRKFGNSEKVEAKFNFGWWSGLITKKLEKKGYIVYFEEKKLDKVVDRSELRPHMDWKDEKWFIVSAPVDGMDKTPSSSTANSDNHKTESSTKRRRRRACLSDPEGAMKKHKGEIEDVNRENEVTTIEKMLEVENVVGEVGRIEEITHTPPLIDDSEGAMKKRKGEIEDANRENEVTTIEKMLEVENEVGKVGRIEEITHTLPLIDELASTETAEAMLDSIPPNEVGMTADKTSVVVAIEQTNLPFVKRNAVWKAFKSMEIFGRIPQNPHFEPLQQVKESLREGLAIGCMVNFTNAVDRCCSFKIKDPKCVFDDIEETLLDLDGHGFDVAAVQNHMRKLLAMKEREEKLVHEMNDLKDRFWEHDGKKIKIKKEIGVMNEHLRRLQEQLSITEIAEAKEVDEIARLQASLKEIEERIKNVRCDFEGVAARLETAELDAPPSDGGGIDKDGCQK